MLAGNLAKKVSEIVNQNGFLFLLSLHISYFFTVNLNLAQIEQKLVITQSL